MLLKKFKQVVKKRYIKVFLLNLNGTNAFYLFHIKFFFYNNITVLKYSKFRL